MTLELHDSMNLGSIADQNGGFFLGCRNGSVVGISFREALTWLLGSSLLVNLPLYEISITGDSFLIVFLLGNYRIFLLNDFILSFFKEIKLSIDKNVAYKV